MSIVDSIIQRKRGEPSHYIERPVSKTAGHSATEGGLRGHSVGDTWPYRVVGYGNGMWAIETNGGGGVRSTPPMFSVSGAHEIARLLARAERERDLAPGTWPLSVADEVGRQQARALRLTPTLTGSLGSC